MMKLSKKLMIPVLGASLLMSDYCKCGGSKTNGSNKSFRSTSELRLPII